MATSAGDLIRSSLRLIGQLAEGETASADTMQDSLKTLNQMLESWSIERLSVYSTMEQSFTWPAGQSTRTIGPTGNFVGIRPVLVDDATYFKDASTGVSYGLTRINQEQYDGIALKTVTSTYPQLLFVNNTYPDLTMTVYPVPNKDLLWYIVSVEQLANIENQADDLALPPGYERALKYNLACELAPEFGLEPSSTIQRIASAAKRNIKRINAVDDVMSMPDVMVGGNQRFNAYSGNY